MTSLRCAGLAAVLMVAAAVGLSAGSATAEPSSKADTSTGSTGDSAPTTSGHGQEPADQPSTSAGTINDSAPKVTFGDQPPEDIGVGSGQEPSDDSSPLNLNEVYAAMGSTSTYLRDGPPGMGPNSQIDLIQLQKTMQDWTIQTRTIQTQLQVAVVNAMGDALKNQVSGLR